MTFNKPKSLYSPTNSAYTAIASAFRIANMFTAISALCTVGIVEFNCLHIISFLITSTIYKNG